MPEWDSALLTNSEFARGCALIINNTNIKMFEKCIWFHSAAKHEVKLKVRSRICSGASAAKPF